MRCGLHGSHPPWSLSARLTHLPWLVHERLLSPCSGDKRESVCQEMQRCGGSRKNTHRMPELLVRIPGSAAPDLELGPVVVSPGWGVEAFVSEDLDGIAREWPFLEGWRVTKVPFALEAVVRHFAISYMRTGERVVWT